MAFNRPTLAQLIARNKADLESNIDGANAQLQRSNLGVIAKLIAGVAHSLYGYIAYLVNQILPDTAETTYLDRHASLWLAVPRKAASYAVGTAQFSGSDGITIPAGTVLIRADGVEYETDADVTIAAGVANAAITALEAGQNGNAAASIPLALSSPIAGVNSSVVVTALALTGGADQESDDDLRARVIGRIQNPPHGGSKSDYETWALEVPGVTRAWVYDQELGPGTVTLRFVRDDDASLIPDAAEVLAVQTYIDERRQVGLKAFYVVAPTAAPINFNIALTPNNAATKAAVEAELRDLIAREATPGGTILLSHIREAISIAAGETNYVMSAPNADVTNTTGNISTFGAITWA